MTRQIICLKCAEKPQHKNYPGEWWRQIIGYARGFENGDFVCDQCNESIPKGTKCVAQSFGRDSQPYQPWETDYLGEGPGIIDGTIRVFDEDGNLTEAIPPKEAEA